MEFMQFVANIVFLSNKAEFVLEVELRLKNLFGSFVGLNENFNAMKLLRLITGYNQTIRSFSKRPKHSILLVH